MFVSRKLASVSSSATASAEGAVEVEGAGAAAPGLSVIEAGGCCRFANKTSIVDARYQSWAAFSECKRGKKKHRQERLTGIPTWFRLTPLAPTGGLGCL